ncbi:MAG: hypothetical protein VKL97_05200 [Cyanobacteriota bacterium]|nr:hypothetical protein [Cyanobacteriota bacterium]
MPVQLAALGLTGLLAVGSLTQAVGAPALLQCRLADGPWQRCRMLVEDDGLGWTLELPGELIRFRHDGRGAVSMERSRQPWRAVQARWLADASLCWDGVCAKGAIPLD